MYDQYIEHLVETQYPKAKLLQQIPGVGALTSLAFILTLDDPGRFPKSRKVESYLGLRPRQDQSGDSNPQLGITKGGGEFFRRLMVNAAHCILGHFGPDSDLRRWGLAIAPRGGQRAKKRAVAAVPRKLAVLLHHLWLTGEVYDPFHHSSGKAAHLDIVVLKPHFGDCARTLVCQHVCAGRNPPSRSHTRSGELFPFALQLDCIGGGKENKTGE
ncbi:MAG: IS110 family transposase [Acidobacteriia bacterium]|nr:IS110 family transposase [Terriglobia bacterium]